MRAKLPYSGKFLLVQIFVEKRPGSSEEIFCGFYFRRTRDALTTPLPVDATSSDHLLCYCMTSMITRVSLTMKLGKSSSVIEGGNVNRNLEQPLVSA